MAAINGNNIIVYRGGTAIAAVKSHEIQVNNDLIEISSASDGEWKHYIQSRKEWTLNVNYLVMADSPAGISAKVRELLTVGTAYTLRVHGRAETDSAGVGGQAILKTCRIVATRGNLVQGSFSFVGTGPLTQ